MAWKIAFILKYHRSRHSFIRLFRSCVRVHPLSTSSSFFCYHTQNVHSILNNNNNNNHNNSIMDFIITSRIELLTVYRLKNGEKVASQKLPTVEWIYVVEKFICSSVEHNICTPLYHSRSLSLSQSLTLSLFIRLSFSICLCLSRNEKYEKTVMFSAQPNVVASNEWSGLKKNCTKNTKRNMVREREREWDSKLL